MALRYLVNGDIRNAYKTKGSAEGKQKMVAEGTGGEGVDGPEARTKTDTPV